MLELAPDARDQNPMTVRPSNGASRRRDACLSDGAVCVPYCTGVTPRPRAGLKGVAKRWRLKVLPGTWLTGVARGLAATMLTIGCGDYDRKPSQGEEYCRSHPESSDCRHERCADGDLAECQLACKLGDRYGCDRLDWECHQSHNPDCPETPADG
jgi:hypothetical protein